MKLGVAGEAIPVPLRSIAAPGHVLSPGAGFRVPQVVIRTPEDVNAFGRAFISEDFQWEPGALYPCPIKNHGEPSVTFIGQEGRGTLVHCYHCGYRDTLMEILQQIYKSAGTIAAATAVWPDKVVSGMIDGAEIGRVRDAIWRIGDLDNARKRFQTTFGKDTPAVFGEWGTMIYREVLYLLSRESIPQPYDQSLYHVNILRNQTGDVVAADFYSSSYEPLFRHWLRSPLEVEEALFCVVPWGDQCDPKNGTKTFDTARDAYDAAQQALQLPAKDRPRIAMAAAGGTKIENRQ